MIDVVSAIIVRDGRILLTQRRPTQDFAFTWESPGGKVEPGESHWEALRRELREELGVTCRLGWCATMRTGEPEALYSSVFTNVVQREDRASVHVFLYACDIDCDAQPRPLEGQGMGWFGARELDLLSLAPCNAEARTMLIEYVDGWRPQ